MGGDRAPDAVVAGVHLALKEVKAKLVLLGEEDKLRPHLSRLKALGVEFVDCGESIGMDESPVQAVRGKKDSSIVQGLKASAADSDNSAFFSAGHSGAVFAAALLAMGRIEGVERPAIVTTLPTLGGGHCILLDAGANIDCRPNHLRDFAYMGSTYARVYLRQARPTVGILSNGEEESKGTDLTRAAHALLKDDPHLNYVGYVEGKEIFTGKQHVVVTDGFTGNVVLKSLEGLGKTVSAIIRGELERTLFTKLGALFSMPALRNVQRKLDYAEVGAAPLLGVDGNCFIGHGRSNALAIKNGILRAQEAIELRLHPILRDQFRELATAQARQNATPVAPSR
ncbi:MAG: phosphate acyltransferase PlsX [Deltaproteobacteria bacterium]|nr:phosphate acyltransferase PlsX [Deltaproteobacteria bacterium]